MINFHVYKDMFEQKTSAQTFKKAPDWETVRKYLDKYAAVKSTGSLAPFEMKKKGNKFLDKKIENIKHMTMLVLDYDSGCVDLETVRDMWCEVPHYIHPTKSATKENPRCRVILPLSKPVTTSEFERLVMWAKERSANMGLKGFDENIKAVSRVYEMPSIPADGLQIYQRGDETATPLSMDTILGLKDKLTAAGDYLHEDEAEIHVMAGDQFLDLGKSTTTAQEFYSTSKIGDKIKIYCPTEGNTSSLGCAFAYRVQGGVRVICTSARHNHPETPMTWFHGTSTYGTNIPAKAVVKDLQISSTTKLPKTNAFNLHLILNRDGRFAGNIRFDTFGFQTIYTTHERQGVTKSILKKVTRPISDDDFMEIRKNINAIYNIDFQIPSDIRPMAAYVASENKYSSIKEDFIDKLPDVNHYPDFSDGGWSEFLDTWLIRSLSLPDTQLYRAYSRKYAIAMMARIIDPGCKCDTVMVILGEQGKRKGLFYKALAGRPYYTDAKLHIKEETKYVPVSSGKWLIEIGEIDKDFINKYDASDLKDFVTKEEDRYVPKYIANVTTRKRQFVLAGSSNVTEILTDTTGSRRYWIVDCHGTGEKTDYQWIDDNREKIFSAAKHAYYHDNVNNDKDFPLYWLSEEEEALHKVTNEGHSRTDVQTEWIESFVSSHPGEAFTTHEIAAKMSGKEDQFNVLVVPTHISRHIASALRRMGATYDLNPLIKRYETDIMNEPSKHRYFRFPGVRAEPLKIIENEARRIIG